MTDDTNQTQTHSAYPDLNRPAMTDPETVARITTSGRTLRPFLEPATELVDELKLTFDAGGVRTAFVDRANVGMGILNANAIAFDRFDVAPGDSADGRTVGVDLKALTTAFRANVRKGKRTDDPCTLDVTTDALTVGVTREYGDDDWQVRTERSTDVPAVDPDSLRLEPDAVDMPDEYAPVTLPVAALRDIVDALTDVGDHVRLSTRDGALHFETVTADSGAGYAVVQNATTGPDVSSLYSKDYLRAVTDALRAHLADRVTLTLADHYPLILEFTRFGGDDGHTELYSGMYCIAPRIQAELDD